MTFIRSAQREHHWDALRAVLMLLGIPYHVAMTYRAGQVWILNAGEEGSKFFTYAAQIIHVFRMPAFFFIAGYFAALLLARRSPGQWLRGRFMRLGIPLIVSLLTLNPLLNIACELTNFPPAEALASWIRNSETSGGYWVRHLWFIIVLLYDCLIAATAVWLFPRLRDALLPVRLDGTLARHVFTTIVAVAIFAGVWEAVSIELFYAGGFATNVPQEILRLDQFLEFTPYFLFGCLLSRAPKLQRKLYRFSPAIAVIAFIALALDLTLMGLLSPPAGRFLDAIAGVTIAQLFIALMKWVADRPSPFVRELVDASFVIYLFHLPILALLVLAGHSLAIPLALKASLITVLVLGLSFGAWRFIRTVPLLRLAFDGISKSASLSTAGLGSRDVRNQTL
jgi:glucan biosynthesis protein C